jgi:hypothetical protein
MIKYHGTPVGGTKHDSIKFLNGRHALISHAYPIQTPEVLECCESFCLDNGAFTIWKNSKGGAIDMDSYKKWVLDLSRHPAFDFYLIPDKIGGTEKENDELIEQWGDDVRCGVPVFHLGGNPDRFFRLADKYPKVAFGSTDKWARNGTNAWWKDMADFMDIITDDEGFLPCKVHGLRMLDTRITQYLPLHSGDSTNAGVNGARLMRSGSMPAITRWQGNERIAYKIEAVQPPSVWNRELLIKEGIL